MKQSVDFHSFRDAFKASGLIDTFSASGLEALYGWIIKNEESCDTETELDVDDICCEFTEYEDIKEFHGDYDADDCPDMEAIEDSTYVILIPGSDGFIIQDF